MVQPTVLQVEAWKPGDTGIRQGVAEWEVQGKEC